MNEVTILEQTKNITRLCFMGVALNINNDDNKIFWCTDWGIIDLMEEKGIVYHKHYGGNTYGHTSYFLKQ